jgi:hypothetical protein
MLLGHHVKYPLFLSDFNETLIFSTTGFRIFLKYPISRKSVAWEPNFSIQTDRRADRQTDVTKLIVTFRNFANPLRNVKKLWHFIL